MRLQDRTTLITGAASGIGRALAEALAARGSRLALADIDSAGLAETARRVEADAPHVTAHVLDIADRDAIAALPEAVKTAHGGLDLLVNNAGVALGGTFADIDEADFDWLFAINFFGVVRMTRAFLPMLRRSDDARIVNISSLFGLIATPGQTAYTASKFAVRGFSESLRHELAGSRIGITTVHPGGVATSIAANARLPKALDPAEGEKHKRAFAAFLKMQPETAAADIVRGIEARKPRLIIGRDAKIAALLERIAPVGYWRALHVISRRRGF